MDKNGFNNIELLWEQYIQFQSQKELSQSNFFDSSKQVDFDFDSAGEAKHSCWQVSKQEEGAYLETLPHPLDSLANKINDSILNAAQVDRDKLGSSRVFEWITNTFSKELNTLADMLDPSGSIKEQKVDLRQKVAEVFSCSAEKALQESIPSYRKLFYMTVAGKTGSVGLSARKIFRGPPESLELLKATAYCLPSLKDIRKTIKRKLKKCEPGKSEIIAFFINPDNAEKMLKLEGKLYSDLPFSSCIKETDTLNLNAPNIHYVLPGCGQEDTKRLELMVFYYIFDAQKGGYRGVKGRPLHTFFPISDKPEFTKMSKQEFIDELSKS